MKLRKVYIEITNVCNLRCSFCKKCARKPEYMSVDKFKLCIERVKALTGYIYLHVLGEPLMHPELERLLQICVDEAIKVSVTTNASHINIMQNIMINKPCLKQFNYSLHSLSEQDRAQDIEKTVSDIFKFIQICDHGIYHHLRLWNIRQDQTPENGRILCEIEKNARKPGFIFEKILNAQKRQKIKLSENVELCFDESFDWPDINGKELYSTGGCRGLRHDCAVLVDGTVVPCCLDADGVVALGNIFENSLEDILSSERAKNMREGFSRREKAEKLCRTCGFSVSRFL